ncbi:Nicotinamidase-related amidase [Lentzea albidocapillata subsp. violacea]|uniref:Nicotinamidase-related amidase n=1 Tax=Lentzea albidocapillata subsp. violacea TaxID=128104 RepID=A0A1G9YN16_9PSEU|nr:isochorismatase family cysteine hydrolase [Lentzea albidocapillata]SDN10450.1 Nicotinamidase-related amidase [Lentzea albidocapillata subsp. violacea]
MSTHGNPSTSFDPARTAVLVIDPVNDFLHEEGAAWEMTKSTVKKNDVVAQLSRLAEGARAAGVPVLFGPMAYTAEDYADEGLQRRSGINRLMFENRMFLAGSFGADFHPDIQPQPGDIILAPHKGTDVLQTDLREHLDRLGTTHLVIAGMTANLCVESTGRHATELGYDVTFLSDAIGAESLPAYEASIHLNFPLIANAVLEVDEFLGSIATGATPAEEGAQPGDTVYGSDRGQVGTVEEVVAASDGVPAYLVVQRGAIFDKHLFVPLDAVTHRSGTSTFINIPKLVVSKLPWDERPTAEAAAAKLGPSAAEVAALYRTHAPTGG